MLGWIQYLTFSASSLNWFWSRCLWTTLGENFASPAMIMRQTLLLHVRVRPGWLETGQWPGRSSASQQVGGGYSNCPCVCNNFKKALCQSWGKSILIFLHRFSGKMNHKANLPNKKIILSQIWFMTFFIQLIPKNEVQLYLIFFNEMDSSRVLLNILFKESYWKQRVLMKWSHSIGKSWNIPH